MVNSEVERLDGLLLHTRIRQIEKWWIVLLHGIIPSCHTCYFWQGRYPSDDIAYCRGLERDTREDFICGLFDEKLEE